MRTDFNSQNPKRYACILLILLHLANASPDLKLYDACIPVVSEFKFLGLIFDKKLTLNKHVKYLKDRCMKVLNLLRVVAVKDWSGLCDIMVVVRDDNWWCGDLQQT